MKRIQGHILLGALLLPILAGCRGMESERPPILPQQNMVFQERFNAQQANPLFADNRAMRTPPAGTVPRGRLQGEVARYTGRTPEGTFIQRAPVEVTQELLLRGQQRYNIYCGPCHSPTGDGQGVVFNYGWAPAPSFHEERLVTVEDGYYFDVITHGIRTMMPYRHQVQVEDRWAIVTYIRALQRSQRATRADVPPEILPTIDAAIN